MAALRLLAARKGYRFVGTTSAANDAFFVREDYAERFVDAALERVVALPSMARESRDEQGRPEFHQWSRPYPPHRRPAGGRCRDEPTAPDR
ncbi:MAG: hypothetical protein WDN45_02630 [Caulobacteraceae bacterium]